MHNISCSWDTQLRPQTRRSAQGFMTSQLSEVKRCDVKRATTFAVHFLTIRRHNARQAGPLEGKIHPCRPVNSLLFSLSPCSPHAQLDEDVLPDECERKDSRERVS